MNATTWFILGLAVAVVSFLIYRIVDLLQLSHIKKAPQPQDLEKLTAKIYEKKRQNKIKRTNKIFWKGTVSWGVQLAYALAMPFTISYLHKQHDLSPGTIYTSLMVASFLLNLLLSKLFTLWTLAPPFACRAREHERVLRLGNVAWQAWGVVAWAGPVYFLYPAFGAYGWVGSVLFTFLSQLAQLVFFIYTMKKRATPYQEYKGLSKEFKESLHTYLQGQEMDDEEVGVVEGMKVGPNAFATSLSDYYRQIVLTKELVEGYPDPANPDFTLKLEDDTLESVVSHEVGHIVNHHVEKMIFFGFVVSALSTIAVYHLFSNIELIREVFGFLSHQFPNIAKTDTRLSLYFGQALLNVLLVYPMTFIMISLVRRNEVQADTHLLETNGCKNGKDFFHQIRHIAPVPNNPLWDRCNSTHPAPHLREERMKKHEEQHCK